MLSTHGDVTGVEFFETAAQLAREQSRRPVLEGPAESIPIPDERFE